MAFSKTCKNINLDGKTGVLSANSLDGTGDYPYSEIHLSEHVHNDNGLLRWGRGGFLNSCSTRGVYLEGDTVIMKAECQKTDGTWTDSQLDLDAEITNHNGRLVYVGRDPGAPYGGACNPGRPTVAFCAVRNQDMVASCPSSDVTYDETYLNEGNGLNPWSGHFTVPVSGIYQISFSFLTPIDRQAHVALMLNGGTIIHGHAETNFATGNNLLVLHLNAGDRVWLRLNQKEEGMFGRTDGKYTTFSGFLLSVGDARTPQLNPY